MVTIARADGSIQYVSPAVQEQLGYAPENVARRNIFDYVHPEDLAVARTTFGAALQKPGYAIPLELRLRTHLGSYVPFEVTTNNLLHSPGVAGVVISARDVSRRKLVEREFEKQKRELQRLDQQRSAELAAANRRLLAEIKEREHTENALRESQSLLQATLESTADGILVVDLHGRIVSFNQRFVDMWGLPEDILQRQSDKEAINLRMMASTLHRNSLWLAGETVRF